MEVYEVIVEDYHEYENSLGLFKNLKDAIKVAEEYRIKTVDNDKWVESYEEVFNDWHLMEWVAVGKYANHGITIDKRNVLDDVSKPLAPKEVKSCMKADLKCGEVCKEHCGASWC